MKKIKFEYKITLAYLIIGALWIVFSDKMLNSLIPDKDFLSKIQTFKGWFYVLVTGILFLIFLQKHLSKLRKTELELAGHKDNLQQLVLEKTKDLDAAIEELQVINNELFEKNSVINDQYADLKSALNYLQDTQAQLIQAEKMASIGILTTGVAHEINNPLNYIMGGLVGLEKILRKAELYNDKAALFLESIQTGVDRASAIVSALNQLSRNNESYSEACDIHQIIDNCLTILNSQIKNKIEIKRMYASKPFVLLGNVGKLHQVFLNVLMNACQSINNTGTITITTQFDDPKVICKISDTGCGIRPEDMSKIVEPFFTTKEPGKGTGLGLSISSSIIKDHHGYIDFQSELNVGTIVTIELSNQS